MNVTGAFIGFFVGGAAGFLLTETVGAFFTFVLDRTLDVDGTPVLLAAFVAVPVLSALIGAAARRPRHEARLT
ncbi:hypothetical protein [Actinomadura madurae]|uniref:hypothetical protein n=1 Tax=Actinomadura madurae TaxID=1993 RepID=UPI0020D21D8A|nr:hypothetical protein [Actinomadura madurae]MCQ0011290.1 hypothetical protein [Actinomadura madurae]